MTELFPTRHIGTDDDAQSHHARSASATTSRRGARQGRRPRRRSSVDDARDVRPARAARASARRSRELRALAARNTVEPHADRPRLLRHHHAGRHQAERAREPELVHRVHAVPAGDLAGPPRGADQLPDHGLRPHRARHGQRVDARRGHGRRRGDAAGPPRLQGRVDAVHRRRRHVPADARAAAATGRRRSASSSSCSTCASTDADARPSWRTRSASSCSTPAPPGGSGTRPAVIAAAKAAGAVVVAAADLLALTLLTLAGRARSRRRRRHQPALRRARWASAVRTPATWPCARASSASCPAAWSASRRMRSASPPTGSPCRRASSTSAARRPPRTSAPPRCCSPSWPAMYAVYHGPRGLQARSASQVHSATGAVADALRAPGVEVRLASRSSTRSQVARRRRGATVVARAHEPRHPAARRRTRRPVSLSLDEESADDLARRRLPARRLVDVFAPGTVDGRRRRARLPSVPLLRRRARPRESAYLTHPVFNTHHSETAMMRYLKHLRRQATTRSTAA